MSYLPGKFIWFEHMSSDAAQARAFYGELFGWKISEMPMGDGSYTAIMNGENAIGGVLQTEPGARASWMGYVSVGDVDATAQAAQAAGAQILQPPTDYPPVGRGATLSDPQGAVFSIWKMNDGDRPDVESVPVGEWCWNELVTSDPQAACAFYSKLLGYQVEEMPMADSSYYLLKTGAIGRGGVMKAPPGAQNFWEPYVNVADCDAIHARALRLGASTCLAPTDIPDVGRIAIFQDPAGAILGVIRPNPRQ